MSGSGVTILILYRGDSIRRLYNLVAVARYLSAVPGLEVYVREADSTNRGIARMLMPAGVRYEFVTDVDSVLHKTAHFNSMLASVDTPIAGIWDTDVIPYDDALTECVGLLESGACDMALPYNGICLDVPEAVSDIYISTGDFGVIDANSRLMRRLSGHLLTGGSVLMKLGAFCSLGGENEAYYGWGDDDFDRYIRFMKAGLNIYRSKTPLFHLCHPRGTNSGYASAVREAASKAELSRTINL